MLEVEVFDDVFRPDELDEIHQVRRSFPAYIPSGRKMPKGRRPPHPARPLTTQQLEFAPQLGGRADVGRYVRRLSQHMFNSTGEREALGHTSYLRGNYVIRGQPVIDGMEGFLHNDRLADLALGVYDADRVVPYAVYANVFLPGQVLHPHTDIPAFRGAELGQLPSWLLVAMHHSGLFEQWRLPVATVIGHPTSREGAGGEFSYYPQSKAAPATVTLDPPFNSVVILDADTIFHRVDQVAGETSLLPEVQRGAFLVPAGADLWQLHQQDRADSPLATFSSDELRFTISWKAYCFAGEAAQRRWAEHTDDLAIDDVIPTLTELLRDRGVLAGSDDGLDEGALAAVIIDELIPFPPPGT